MKTTDIILSGFQEGVLAFKKRFFTSFITQSLVIAVLIWIAKALVGFKQDFYFYVGFFLAIGIFSLLQAHLFVKSSKRIKRLLEGNFSYAYQMLQAGVFESFKTAFLCISVYLSTFVFLWLLLGKMALLGGFLAALLLSFLLRLGGGLFQVSSDGFSNDFNTIENKLPKDLRNPASILEILGTYLGSFLGLIHDFCLSVLLLLFLPFFLCRNHPLVETISWHYLACFLAFVSLLYILTYLFMKKRFSKTQHNALLEVVYVYLFWFFVVKVVFLGFLFIFKPTLFFNFIPISAVLFIASLGIALMVYLSDIFTSVNYSPLKRTAKSAQIGAVYPLLHATEIGLQSSGFLFVVFGLIFGSVLAFFGKTYLLYILLGSSIPLIGIFVIVIFYGYNLVLEKMAFFMSDSIKKDHIMRLKKITFTVTAFGNALTVLMPLLASLSLFLILDVQFVSGNEVSFVWVFLLGMGIEMFYLSSFMQVMLQLRESLIFEVRRQFREIPYLLDGKVWPDIAYAANKHALLVFKKLQQPALLVYIFITAITFGLGERLYVAVLMGLFLFVCAQSYQWANVGDVLHNSMRYILHGRFGGKNSVSHHNIQTAVQFSSTFQVVLAQASQFLLKLGLVFYFMVYSLS